MTWGSRPLGGAKKGNPKGPPSHASKENRIEDVSVDSLVFSSSQRGLSTGITQAVEDGHLEETMHGASGLKLELLDRDYAAMKSGLYGTRVVCEVDGAAFRLTEVSVVDDWKVAAVLEHRLVAEMREHTGTLKARRGKVTRAEFVLMMLRELKLPYTFICPELHRTQQTPKPEKTKETVTVKTTKKGKTTVTRKKTKLNHVKHHLSEVGRGPAVAPKVQKSPTKTLTSKGQPLSQEQTGIVTEALNAAKNTGASRLSMVAVVVALIQENDISNPKPGEPGDRGCLSLIDSTISGIGKHDGRGHIDPYNVTEVVEHFCTAGFTGAGGSNALARKYPSASATGIATSVQGPKVEYPHSWEAEAREIVDAFLGGAVGGGEGSISGGGSFTGEGSNTQQATTIKTATYEFTRGTPGQRESTFECALRLAEEVQWRFFVCGKDEIYFVNDDDLLKAEPRYLITPESLGLVKLTFDVEVGARTIIVGSKRQPKPSEATLIVRAKRWAAPPGCVIQLEGWGPADHPWLVDTVERGLYDAETTIQIRAPQHPLEEPKATASGTGEPGKEIGGEEGANGNGSQAGSPAAAAEEARKALSERAKYVYSQEDRENHGTLFGPAPRKMDCSSFVTLCYKEAGLPDPNGKGYNGLGTTYTLIPRCTQVKNPRPGDLCFYGSRSAPHHVNIYVGGGKSINMGGPGDPKEEASEFAGFIGYFRPR